MSRTEKLKLLIQVEMNSQSSVEIHVWVLLCGYILTFSWLHVRDSLIKWHIFNWDGRQLDMEVRDFDTKQMQYSMFQ